MSTKHIPLMRGRVNAIANAHTAYLSLANFERSLVISVRAPNVLKKRYGFKRIIWLTRISSDYPLSFYPDRLEFEVMEKVQEFASEGGDAILIDGVEYLALLFGTNKLYDWIFHLKSLREDITIILAVNGPLDPWKGIADFTHEERARVPGARIYVSKKPPKEDHIILSTSQGDGRIDVNMFGDARMFLLLGIEEIMRRNPRGVYVECIDYLLRYTDMMNLVEFLKNLADHLLYSGGFLVLNYADSLPSTPLVALLDNLGAESSEVFVGREKEMKIIMEMLDRGRGALIISGEVGIGKTTLVNNAKNYAIVRGFKFTGSRCYYDSGEPYLPIVEAFENFAGSLSSGDFKPQDQRNFEFQRNAMFFDFAKRIKNAVSRERMMVFFDDIHWMDPSSLKLLHYLISNLKEENIVFVCTYRPEEMKDELKDVLARMRREHLYNEIRLRGLTREDIGRIARYILDSDVPHSFIDMIYEKSGGNPLFAKELIHHLLREGSLNPREGVYPESAEVSIPSLIKDLVQRRLGKLEKGERRIVEMASVLGYRVDPEILQRITGTDIMDLMDTLEKAEKAGIWSEEEDGAYVFSERIIRDGIYESLPKLMRRMLHSKIAEEMERVYGDEEARLREIAEHYARGGKDERAFEFFVRAAEYAEDMYAHEDAIALFTRALEMKMKESQKMDIHGKIANIYKIIGNYRMASEHYKLAAECAERNEDKRRVAEFKIMRGNVEEHMGNHDLANSLYKEAERLLPDDDPLRAKVHLERSWMMFRRGQMEEAIKDAMLGAEIAERTEDIALRGLAHHILGTIYWQVGRYGDAENYLKMAVELRKREGNPYGLAADYNNLGVLYNDMGRQEEALEYYMKAYNSLKRMGHLYGTAITANNIGGIYGRSGDLDKALEYFLINLSISEMIGDLYAMGLAYLNIGSVYIDWGRLDEAMQYIKKSLEVRERQSDAEGIASSYCSLAEVEYLRGNVEGAIEYCEKALKIYEDMGSTLEIATTKRNLADYLFEKGLREEALKLLKESLEISERLEGKENMLYCYAYLSTILSESGDNEAIEYGERALRIAEEMNSDKFRLVALLSLGITNANLGNYNEGKKRLEEAIELSRRIRYRGYEGIALYHLGRVQRRMGEEEESRINLKSALKIFKELNYTLYIEKVRNELLGE